MYMGLDCFVSWKSHLRTAAVLFCISQAACIAPPLRPVPPGTGSPEKINLTKTRYPLQTRDGLNLYAWYIPATQPKAIVLQFHDDGISKSEAFQSLAWLPGKGFGLFTFDYRGYGRSQGKPTPEKLQEDARVVLDFAHAFAAKRKTKLIVYGQGLGGLIALRAIPRMKSQRELAGVAVEGYYSSYKDFARGAYGDAGCVFPFNVLAGSFVRDPYEAPASGRSPGVLKKVPLFVLHGQDDSLADWQGARNLFHSARKPRFFLDLPAGHDVWRDERSRPFQKTVVRLFETAAGDGDFTEIGEQFEPENAEY